MRPESGVSLVSGALQSSLARAHKNNTVKDSTDSHPKDKFKVNAHLSDYCDSIGSKFAASSVDHLATLAASLDWDKASFLTRSIPENIRKSCIVLEQEDGELVRSRKIKERQLLEKLKKFNVSLLSIGRPLTKNRNTVVKESENLENKATKTANPNNTKVDHIIAKIRQQLGEKTVGKGKRKRLLRKLRKFKDIKSQSASEICSDDPKLVSPAKIASPQKLAIIEKVVGKKMGPETERKEVALTNGNSNSHSSPSQLPEPKRVLYPKEKIMLGWRAKRGPGAGFHNFGNTCYLNSSLQALFHIPAFVNWIFNDEEHRKICNGTLPNQSPCIICVVYATLQDHTKSFGSIRPKVLDKLRAICKHFNYGRQEDAHEFLRYLLEGMERSYLTLINGLRLDNRTKETNPLGQIFGGYVRTEVTCMKCGFVSTTFQPSAELHLDIRHSTTLEDALQLHFRRERLDNNDYKCEKCRTISQATKQFSLELPPLVLCLQLKRFTLYGTKISKRIHCNRYLNMAPFLHKSRKNGFQQNKEILKYRLVALVTHLGSSPNCGHYTAIAEGWNSTYYQFDDQFVHEVSLQNALNNDAYVIIYEMDRSSQSSSSAQSLTSISANTANNGNSSTKPCTVTSGALTNGTTPKKFAVPFAKSNGVNSNNNTPKTPVISNTDASKMNGEKKLITFGIPPNSLINSGASSANTTPTKINILKPGAVLTSANSAKLYSTKSTPVAVKPSPSPVVPKASCIKLVPYNDVENEESEKEDEILPKEVKKQSEEDNKKVAEPEVKVPFSPKIHPKTPPVSPLVSSNKDKPSLEKTFGVKRKLEEIMGPSKSPKNSPLVVNATTSWTITNGNSHASDEDEVDGKSDRKLKEQAKICTERRKSDDKVINPKKPCFSTPVKENNGHHRVDGISPTLQNGHSPVIKKRKRSQSPPNDRASSPSSDEDRKRHKKEAKKKKKAKKEKHHHHKSKKRSLSPSSSSSSITDSESSSIHTKHHKSKKVNHNEEAEEPPKVNGWKVEERETSSAERERELRKARNPSRSPSRSKENGIKFDPSKIEHRDKTIMGWNGEESMLSKSINADRKIHSDKSRDGYDDELDQGRVKKQRRSHSPSRDHEGSNKFQNIQDRQKLVSKWSKVLDGYGDGFKDHHNKPLLKTPPSAKKSWDRKFNKSSSDHDFERGGGRHSGGGGYRNNHHNKQGYHNGHRDNRYYDKDKSYKSHR